MTGAEVDILRVLKEKYEFDLHFFTATFGNVQFRDGGAGECVNN